MVQIVLCIWKNLDTVCRLFKQRRVILDIVLVNERGLMIICSECHYEHCDHICVITMFVMLNVVKKIRD